MVADVLTMAAGELGNPIAVVVAVKADDDSIHISEAP
jgi:hypothetical protein